MFSARKISTTWLLGLMAAAALLFQTTSVSAESIGIAPTNFDFENLARGQVYERSINVLHDSEETREFRFEATGELGLWVTFFDIESGEPAEILSIPSAGATRAKAALGVRLTIPEDASNGFYTGNVQISGIVTNPTAGSSSATVGASISMFADVTGDQVLSGSLLDASAISIEEGFALRIDTRIDNSGNVQIIPRYEIIIEDAEGTEVMRLEATAEAIGAQQLAARGFELNVDQLQPGDYTARLTAGFRELELGNSVIRFSVVERGTLTRSGVLTGISLINQPIAGEVARIQVDFQNTGQIEANAVFIGEISRDGQLVDVVTSLPQFVTAGQLGQIEVFVDVVEVGEYSLTGKVNFDGKESSPVEISFHVPLTNVIEQPVVDPTIAPSDTGDSPVVDPGTGSDDSQLGLLIGLIVVIVAGVSAAGLIGYRRGWRLPFSNRGLGHPGTVNRKS